MCVCVCVCVYNFFISFYLFIYFYYVNTAYSFVNELSLVEPTVSLSDLPMRDCWVVHYWLSNWGEAIFTQKVKLSFCLWTL